MKYMMEIGFTEHPHIGNLGKGGMAQRLARACRPKATEDKGSSGRDHFNANRLQ
jgi:hypothetical protein